MNKKVYIVIEILHSIMHFLLFYAVSIAIQSMEEGHVVKYYLPLWIAGYILFAQVVRRLITVYPVFLAVHIAACLAVVVCFQGTSVMTSNLIIVVALFILVMRARKHPYGYAIQPVTLLTSLLFIILYVIASSYHNPQVANQVVVICLAYLVVGYAERYFSNLNRYMNEDKSTTIMGVRRLIMSNSGMLLLFAGLVLATAVLLFWVLPLDALWDYLGKYLYAIFHYLAMMVAYLFADGKTVQPPKAPKMGSTGSAKNMDYTVASVIVAVGIAIIVLRCLYLLYKDFMQATAAPEDTVEYIKPKEKTKLEYKKKVAHKEKKELENAQKIRKLYRRLVKSHRQTFKALRKSQTAQAISANMLQEDVEHKQKQHDYGKLTQLYEKARYSKEKISDEEVKDMKKGV